MSRANLGVVALASAAACSIVGCAGLAATDELSFDDLPLAQSVAEIRIGSVDDPEIGFSRIAREIDVDRDGNIYVLESLDQQLRVYDAQGSLLRRIGQRGQGPGEFERVSRFGVVGDTVWTFDYVGNRITLFDRQGTLLSTARAAETLIPLWQAGCTGHLLPRDMRADGRFISAMSRMACRRADDTPAVDASESIPIPVLLFDATGAVVDTMGWDDNPPPRLARPPTMTGSNPQMLEIDGRPYSVPQPPLDWPSWIRFPAGRVELTVPLPSGPEAFFTLTRIEHSGDTVFSHAIRYEPEAYTSRDLDALAAEAARGMMIGGGGTVDPAIERRLRAEMDFPELRPVSQWGMVDDDERIWIQRYEPAGETSRWIVIDARGVPLAQLELPARAEFKWSRGDVLWVSEPDDLDVPWLVRYRIAW